MPSTCGCQSSISVETSKAVCGGWTLIKIDGGNRRIPTNRKATLAFKRNICSKSSRPEDDKNTVVCKPTPARKVGSSLKVICSNKSKIYIDKCKAIFTRIRWGNPKSCSSGDNKKALDSSSEKLPLYGSPNPPCSGSIGGGSKSVNYKNVLTQIQSKTQKSPRSMDKKKNLNSKTILAEASRNIAKLQPYGSPSPPCSGGSAGSKPVYCRNILQRKRSSSQKSRRSGGLKKTFDRKSRSETKLNRTVELLFFNRKISDGDNAECAPKRISSLNTVHFYGSPYPACSGGSGSNKPVYCKTVLAFEQSGSRKPPCPSENKSNKIEDLLFFGRGCDTKLKFKTKTTNP